MAETLAGETLGGGNTATPNVSIIGGSEFLEDLIHDIPSVQDRALFSTMTFRPGASADGRLYGAMSDKATDKGIQVVFQADAITHLTSSLEIPIWLHRTKKERQRLQEIQHIEKSIQDAGGEFRWLNPGGLLKRILPVSEISHVKGAVLDNTAYVSGPNYVLDDFTTSTDMVARIEDGQTADELDELLFAAGEPERGRIIMPSGAGEIWVDTASKVHRGIGEIIANATTRVEVAAKFKPQDMLLKPLREARANHAVIDYVYNAKPNSPVHRARDLVGTSVDADIPLRRQSAESTKRYGRIHSTYIRADDTIAVTTSVFDRMCERMDMLEIACITSLSQPVQEATQMFETFFATATQ